MVRHVRRQLDRRAPSKEASARSMAECLRESGAGVGGARVGGSALHGLDLGAIHHALRPEAASPQ